MPFNDHLIRPTHRDICHQHELQRLGAADRIVAHAGVLLPILLAEALAARPEEEITDDVLADAGRRAIRAAQMFEREALQFRAECPGGQVSAATGRGETNGRDHADYDHHTS